jgi:deazaflavin-dependent oxidoreductase (nitroreductase family)
VRDDLAALDFCYLTTTGRVSGAIHTIEIWFAARGDRVYLLSGGGARSDWVRNIVREPRVGLRIGDAEMICRASVVTDPDEDAQARSALLEKYGPRYSGDLAEWGRTALPVRIELPALRSR